MDQQTSSITVSVSVNRSIKDVWRVWTNPADIMQWNIPFDHWHSPRVESDLRAGGFFLFRMEAKDGSEGFDHSGKYDRVIIHKLIEYTVSDGRKSVIEFKPDGNSTVVVETFEPENANPVEMQRDFCQAVLDRFKEYAEAKS